MTSSKTITTTTTTPTTITTTENRLDFFIVGLSSHGYEGTGVIRGSYHVCAQYPDRAIVLEKLYLFIFSNLNN